MGSFILNKPKQLRGPLSPHRKDGTQDGEGVAIVRAVLAQMSPGILRRSCVLDIQHPLVYFLQAMDYALDSSTPRA
jgi:hypothetical protein